VTCSQRSQRGFMLYGLVGAVAVAGALGIALMVQNARLDSAAAKLEACHAKYAETLKSVEKANKAVADLEKEAAKRAKSAAAALAKARQGADSLESEIKRLKAAKPADCAAAVTEVRKGLKP
jgi:predicted  nucleic acid-binding Zn-ribbon protein